MGDLTEHESVTLVHGVEERQDVVLVL